MNIVCYDIDAHDQPQTRKAMTGTKLHHIFPTKVHIGGPECAKQHSDRTLFLCWPPTDDPMAYDSLMSYYGDRVVYVGEWAGELKRTE